MRHIRKNYLYNTIYNILSIIIPLVTTPYISRVLGPDGVGKYSYTYSIAYYFILFTMLGLSRYGNRTIAICRDNKQELSKTFCEIYAMQVITGVLSICIYCLCTKYIFHGYSGLFKIQSLYVVSALFDITWFFAGVENFGVMVCRNIVIRLCNLVLIFVLVKSSEDIDIYCLIMAGSLLLSQISLWPILLKRYIKLNIPKLHNIKKHVKSNLLLFIPTISVSVYKVMDKIMLGYLVSDLSVGFYENAEKIVNLPLIFVTSLSTVMLPQMSNVIAAGNVEKEKHYIDKSMIFTLWLSTGMCFGIIGIADKFIPFFLGEAFKECIKLIYILTPTVIFISCGSVISNQILVPHKKDFNYIVIVSMGAIINLILNLITIPNFKHQGAALATLATEITVLVGYITCVKTVFSFRKYVKLEIIFLLSGIIMFYIVKVSCNYLSDVLIMLICKVVIGMLIYLSITMGVFKLSNYRNFLLK